VAPKREQEPRFCHVEAEHGANEVYKMMSQPKIDVIKWKQNLEKHEDM
jgi:hypothetical protein